MEFFLDPSAPPLGLRAILNPLCTESPSNLFVQGLFGIRENPNMECIYLQSSTQCFVDSDTVFIELDLVLQSEEYEYCAKAILNGREKTTVDGKHCHNCLCEYRKWEELLKHNIIVLKARHPCLDVVY